MDGARRPSTLSAHSMDVRAANLISTLGLSPHPEGGYFREIYRSVSAVRPLDQRPERASLTTIYFLLPDGAVSRWHRVASDEVWHYYEGSPLELFTADAEFASVERHMLGPIDEGRAPAHVVPAHNWQAARTTGSYTLVGCTVGPGFDFADFQMLGEHTANADTVRRRHPQAAGFI